MTKVELHDRLRTRCVVACVDPETMKISGAGRVYRDEDIGRRMCNNGRCVVVERCGTLET